MEFPLNILYSALSFSLCNRVAALTYGDNLWDMTYVRSVLRLMLHFLQITIKDYKSDTRSRGDREHGFSRFRKGSISMF